MSFRRLFAPGDVGAFFELFLDNAAQFVIFSGILATAYGLAAVLAFALGRRSGDS